MGKLSREKGAAGERELAALLRPLSPSCSRRSTGEEAQERQGCDLKNTGDFVVQCQVAGKLTPLKKLAEAIAVAKPHEIPLAALRLSSRSKTNEWIAVMRMSDAALLMAAYESEKKRGAA